MVWMEIVEPQLEQYTAFLLLAFLRTGELLSSALRLFVDCMPLPPATAQAFKIVLLSTGCMPTNTPEVPDVGFKSTGALNQPLP